MHRPLSSYSNEGKVTDAVKGAMEGKAAPASRQLVDLASGVADLSGRVLSFAYGQLSPVMGDHGPRTEDGPALIEIPWPPLFSELR